AEEVENLVYMLPAVAQCAAIAVPDAKVNERVCVCAVLRAGATVTLDDIERLFEERGVARFKTPERLEILEALPLTNVGKIDKGALRQLLAVGKI
ncbi:MAG: AMP-binding enzyme, partial [Nocardioidaceae bacterium]